MTEPYPKYILRNIVISGTSVVGGGNVPSGGTTGQYLRKLSGTDYDTEWGTLTVANITDLTATSTELNYVDGVTSNVQTQLNAKLSTTLTSAYVYVGNGSNVATGVAVTGDVTISNAGVTAIGSGVIVNADINVSAAIAQSKMAALTASRAMVTDASGFATVSAATSTEVGYLSGVSSAIQTQLNAKLTSTLTSAYVFVGNGSNVATGVAISGDITISNAGVVAIAGGVIVNADVNASAAIAVSKLAALTASRALVSDGSGFMSASSVTATELGYVSGVTAAIQTQLDNEIATKTVNAIVKAPTVAEDGYAITWDNGAGEYTLSDPVIQGIPTGGTARQFLGKNSGTNYDASWLGLVTTDITDITSTAAELNILDGATLTTTELNYVDGVTSNIQTQLDAKQSSSLAFNAIWVGNGSGIATQLSPGTSGYVLTSVGGAPQWQPSTGTLGGSTGSIDNAILRANGTGGVTVQSSSILLSDTADLTLGITASTAGTTRTIEAAGTEAAIDLLIKPKGTGITYLYGGLTWVNDLLMVADSLASETKRVTISGSDSQIEAVKITDDIATFTISGAAGIVGFANGGDVIIEAGNGLNSGNTNGGDIFLQPGAKNASGLDGNIGLFTTTGSFGSGEKVMFINNATTNASAAPTNGIIVHARDSSDGSANSTLALYTEQAPEATATFTQSHRLKIWINNVEYYLPLDTV